MPINFPDSITQNNSNYITVTATGGDVQGIYFVSNITERDNIGLEDTVLDNHRVLQCLVYVGATPYIYQGADVTDVNWTNASNWAVAGSSVNDLGDLGDVTITTATSGDVLYYNGSAWVNTPVTSIGLQNVVEDLTPQLGGDLDVNGQSITSVSNGDIVLNPDGTGIVDVQGQLQASSPNFPVLAFERTTSLTGGSLDNTTGIASAMRLRTTSNSNMTDGFGGGIVFVLNDATQTSDTNYVSRIYSRRDGADNTGLLQFFTGASGNTLAMTLRADGDVGIGTSAPDTKLHVVGQVKVDDGANPYTLPAADGTADYVLSTDGAGTVSWADAASTHTHALTDLSDTAIFTPAIGDILTWNGSSWVADTPRTSDIATVIVSDTATFVADTSISSNYAALKIDYQLKDSVGTNTRVGTVYACTDNTSVEVTDVSTNSLGPEATIPEFSAIINGTNLEVQITNGNGYTVDMLVSYW